MCVYIFSHSCSAVIMLFTIDGVLQYVNNKSSAHRGKKQSTCLVRGRDRIQSCL
jgi:hypothetical protein